MSEFDQYEPLRPKPGQSPTHQFQSEPETVYPLRSGLPRSHSVRHQTKNNAIDKLSDPAESGVTVFPFDQRTPRSAAVSLLALKGQASIARRSLTQANLAQILAPASRTRRSAEFLVGEPYS